MSSSQEYTLFSFWSPKTKLGYPQNQHIETFKGQYFGGRGGWRREVEKMEEKGKGKKGEANREGKSPNELMGETEAYFLKS